MDQNDYSSDIPNIALNDLIGNFGLYHLNMMIFTFMRNTVFAMDTFVLALSQISTKEANIVCKNAYDFEGLEDKGTVAADWDRKCFYVHATSDNITSIRPCEEWIFLDPKQRGTFTAQWSLVCHRESLHSTTTTAYMFGVLLHTCLWGYFGDKFGRWTSHCVTHIFTIIFGVASLLAPSIFWFMLFRCCVGFCCVSYTVLNTLQVEMMSPKYRSYTNYPGHIGYGLGVVLVAFIGPLTNNWRHLLSIAPIALAITAPWLLFVPESIRWLTVKGKWEKARKEIRLAAKVNLVDGGVVSDSKIDQYFVCTNRENNDEQSRAGFLDLFKHRTYCLNLISLWLSLFLASIVYMMRTFSYDQDSVSQMANFIISGAGEWLCIALAGMCMHFFERKTCLATFVGLCGLSNLIDAVLRRTSNILFESKSIAYTLDAIAKCSSTGGYIVVYLIAVELFPTELRSVAQSLILAAASIGALTGPLEEVILGDQLICSIVLAGISLVAVLLLKYFVIETKHISLVDRIK